MDRLLINETAKTPYICLEKGLFQFSGRSIIEDSIKNFKPVIDWLKSYQCELNVKTTVNFNFDYLNSASSKLILDILKILDELFSKGYNIEINWNYEEGDNDMLDLGIHLKSFIKVPFNFIETETATDKMDDFIR